MGATIKDIAKMVGVSASTVSRVINGNAAISEETRTRIQEAMKELNYHPNSRARNLANGITNTIALVIDAEDENTFANTFFNRSVYAIERAAQKNGYNLLITNDMDEKGSSITSLVYEKKVDGLILPSSSIRKKLTDLLEKEQFPFVVLGEPEVFSEKLDWVDINNYEGGKKAVCHLLEQGYKRVAFVSEEDRTVFAKRRIAGFLDGFREKNIDLDSVEVLICGQDYRGLINNVKRGVEEKRIDAVLCSNNILSYHILKGMREAKIPVPGKLGMVTFDNYPLAEYMEPPLTAVDVDTYRLGEIAADGLIRKINNREVERRNVLIDTELIKRASSERREEQIG